MLPVLFQWADSVTHYDLGHCVNAGLGGMFVISTKCPPLGMEVKMQLDIPAFHLVPRQVSLRCIGWVSRVETCYQLRGFAVAGRFEHEIFEDRFVSAAVS